MTDGHELVLFLQFPHGRMIKESAVEAVFDLQEILMDIIENSNVGILDGNEFCDDTVAFFMYGPDADAIHETINPLVVLLPKLPGSFILKRYGNYGAREEQILLA